jgi:predicted O-linked N-acetylglucosamine transferase (SPINDLY family)
MGRQDWISMDQKEYVEKAVKLAGDIDQLTSVRKVLREEFLNSPVIKGYREAVEKSYLKMFHDMHAAANDAASTRMKAVK